MDLLVELCSRFHLNPALHTLELLSPEGHTLAFKPNVLLGSLNVACVLIKEKVWDEKVVRRPVPKVPEVNNSSTETVMWRFFLSWLLCISFIHITAQLLEMYINVVQNAS